ncbi:MAG TPA: hypothetical protein VGJ30_04685 [Candidatus Angelobacter sp.]|jgi:uncharacterized protein (UPF0332 family)
MLTEQTKKRISDYLGLAMGLFISVRVTAISNEYDLRNSASRLYYALFHVSLAFLLSQGEEIDKIRRFHGQVHTAVGKRMGKPLDRFVRAVYDARLKADYEPDFFVRKYGSDLEKARAEMSYVLKSANANFYWIYQEARKAL